MSYYLDSQGIADIARGASILGTGGGGDPLIGRMLAQQALDEGLNIEVIDVDDLNDDDFVVPTAMMGAPSVMIEKLPNGTEALASLRRMESYFGRTAAATMPIESGGINSVVPLAVAARAGIPVVDGDGMGRAFPELQMETFGAYGISGSPFVVTDSSGYAAVIDTGSDNVAMDDFARSIVVRMGGTSYIAEYSMDGRDVKRTAVRGTLTLAREIGAALREANEQHTDPLAALIAAVKSSIYTHAASLMTGKVVDVHREISNAWTLGRVVIEPFDKTEPMVIEFKNENLVARVAGKTVAIVPDLITVLDLESSNAITTENLRYGQRVRVLAIATPDIMRTEEALALWSPRAFGIDEEWVPMEQLI